MTYTQQLLSVRSGATGRQFTTKLQDGLEFVPAALLAIAFVVICLFQLSGFDWDYDIDHSMYYGSRLWHSELVWTMEYDDKLPLVQLIFSVPALFKSIRAWQLISIGAIVFSAIDLRRTLPSLLIQSLGLDQKTAGLVAVYSSTLYAYLYSALPGSINQINPLSASLFTVGMLLELSPDRWTNNKSIGTSMLAAGLLAVAVSIRPYYILAAMAACAWGALRRVCLSDGIGGDQWRVKPKAIIGTVAAHTLMMSAMIGLVCIGLNILPYVLTDKSSAFMSGLAVMAQNLNPSSGYAIAKSYAMVIMASRDIVFVSLGGSLLFAIAYAWHIVKSLHSSDRKNLSCGDVDVLFCCIALPSLLFLVIFQKHFWDHYLQLYTPFVSIAIALCAGTLLTRLGITSKSIGTNGFLITTLTAFMVFEGVHVELLKSMYQIARPVVSEREAEVRAFTSSNGLKAIVGRDFLYPSSMYFHWRLDQSRHGFPHASNTIHIEQGWWKNLESSEGLRLPRDKVEYCAKLLNEGPRIILDHKGSLAIQCLREDTKSTYERVELTRELTEAHLPSVEVYSRQ